MVSPSPTITAVRDNVDRIELGGKIVYLVGTAHVSRSSADLTEEVIREVRPDAVAVELCSARYESMKDPDRWKKTDIVQVIREGRAFVLMAQLILAAFQRKLGKELNIAPGAEMQRALNVATDLGIPTILADRDIRTTLKRTWATLGFRSCCTILIGILGGLFSSEKIDEAEIERLKSSDALEELMKDFTATLPTVRTALIDERDRYLASKIESAEGKTVVAIVGAGHVPGIKRWLGQTTDRAALEIIPPPSLTGRIIGWLVPASLIGLIFYGFLSAGAATSVDMLGTWAWTTGFWAALGSLVALAHPLTIGATFVVAPFASANPFIASGWIAGLVEAMIRRPTVGDFETIGDDISTIRGIWKNRVSRVLLVMITTNVLGSLGTIIGLSKLWSLTP
jgi:pheromone shutdown-related protein TraB